MQHVHSAEDPARRWRRFCRTGRRMALLCTGLWLGSWLLFFRIAPAPAPAERDAPAKLSWWSAADGAGLDVRALWTPAAFALATPAGFSHRLRRERADLAPPVQAGRPPAAFLPEAAAAEPDFAGLARELAPAPAVDETAAAGDVFLPRQAVAQAPRMVFPAGWESRLFSGIDLNYGGWTNVAWEAQVELSFDRQGVPAAVLLARCSGLPEVDRRLARSASGWRLLEPAAARAGVVTWNVPAAAAEPAPGGAP